MQSRPYAVAILAVALLCPPRSARGYEFEVQARTIGQGYELRSFRLMGADVFLPRRRFVQTLSLDIWDLAGRRRGRRPRLAPAPRGPRLYFTSHLRIGHDFGTWSNGQLDVANQLVDAVDLLPELESELLALDVLYAYFAADNLADGWLDLRVGRQLVIDTLDWLAFDGATVRVSGPLPVAVTGYAGLRVRDASPAGAARFEPDGTAAAECAEYVEGQVPGSGAWRPIDREAPSETSRYDNDFDVCPQREQLMPTFGGAIESRSAGPLWARLGYRRSLSPTPGVIGDVDRFEFPDTGYYPDDAGQAPDWGTDEERVAASLRGTWRFADRGGQLTPYAALRYNLLVGAVDQALLGARVRLGGHAVEPELYYALPTFDGDSIFNVFAIEPYTDLRLTYDVGRPRGPAGGYGRVWLRRFEPGDGEGGAGADAADSNLAYGGQLGVRWRHRQRLMARLDVFHDGGYGGRRTGGYASGFVQATETAGARLRVTVIHFDADLSPALHDTSRATTFGVQAGASYRVAPGVTVHIAVEDNVNRISGNQFRVLGLIDLAFAPEV